MAKFSLSQQLLLLSGIPLLVLLAFAGLLAARTFETWRNVEQIVALQRLISAAEEYTRAIPAEAILSLGSQETGSAKQKALIPAARKRSDAAVASLRQQALAAGISDRMTLASLDAALAIDLPGNRTRVDAGNETLSFILQTMRPATMQAIELIGRIASLSTDASVSRLTLAYNVALSLNDALLVERNVRPIAGPDGRLAPGPANGEATGVAQQDLLSQQFERLAPPNVLPVWHRFLKDSSADEVAILRRNVLGLGGQLDASGTARWTEAIEARLQAMAPVLAACSSSLRQAVGELEAAAITSLAGYAILLVSSLVFVFVVVWNTRRHLRNRITQLSTTMRRLANGDLDATIPVDQPADELGEMADTLASFKESLIERNRLGLARAAAAAALLDEKERLRVTLHAIGDGVIVIDSLRRVTLMNAAAESLTGWRVADAKGNVIDVVLKLMPSSGQPATEAPVNMLIGASPVATQDGDATLTRPDGAEFAIDASAAPIVGQDGGIIGWITVLHDVTESRSLLNRVRQLAHYDALTGLPNRALFHDRLEQALLMAQRSGRRCAVLFLDMDRFKQVNDRLGHAVGDMLLREVGRRLAATMRESDSVARLGGDEFVVTLSQIKEAKEAASAAQRVMKSVTAINRIAGHEINVSFSIGIAIFPDDAQNMDELLMRADAAMYQVKASGRNASAFFDAEMDRASQRREQMHLRLSRALELRQFALFFQAKVDLASGTVIGAEALIRWYPEPGETVSPVDFIPLAEETGLILPIGTWVLNEACRQMRAWVAQGLPPIPVSINVSMKSLRDVDFVETLRAALSASSLSPRMLEIEITETGAMSDPDRTLAILSDIRSLGVRVSIDDFGTGFSSLSHLSKLPVDTIKIDRSFISSMIESEMDAALVRTIIGMAATLRKHVVAEGVETEAQRAMLLQFGCREAQGFLFARPVEPDVFARMLEPEPARVHA